MKALVKVIALALIIIGAIVAFSPARQLPPGVDAVVTIKPSGRTVHLVDDDGNEVGSFTLNEQVTIMFKRAK